MNEKRLLVSKKSSKLAYLCGLAGPLANRRLSTRGQCVVLACDSDNLNDRGGSAQFARG